MANLRNGSGSVTRANGSTFLTADVTVFNDSSADTLTGGKGEDWFFYNKDATGVKDKLTDMAGNEMADDV